MFASNEYLQKVSSEQALTFDYLMRYIHKKQILISKQDFYDLGLIAKEDSLWNEFNDTINLFFKNLRDNNKY